MELDCRRIIVEGAENYRALISGLKNWDENRPSIFTRGSIRNPLLPFSRGEYQLPSNFLYFAFHNLHHVKSAPQWIKVICISRLNYLIERHNRMLRIHTSRSIVISARVSPLLVVTFLISRSAELVSRKFLSTFKKTTNGGLPERVVLPPLFFSIFFRRVLQRPARFRRKVSGALLIRMFHAPATVINTNERVFPTAAPHDRPGFLRNKVRN